jgi:hypothetical protein
MNVPVYTKFKYGGYTCVIEYEKEYDDDNSYYYHHVEDWDGGGLAPLDVNDGSIELMKLWIDCGCPPKPKSDAGVYHNFDREDLQGIFETYIILISNWIIHESMSPISELEWLLQTAYGHNTPELSFWEAWGDVLNDIKEKETICL